MSNGNNNNQECCQDVNILCVNIPGGIEIVLLGIHLEIDPICIRLFTEDGGLLDLDNLTGAQKYLINQVLTSVRNLIPGV